MTISDEYGNEYLYRWNTDMSDEANIEYANELYARGDLVPADETIH